MKRIHLTKAHGTGNDFLILDDLEEQFEASSKEVAAICDRRFGVGADGFIRVAPGDAAPVFMDYRNSDGSFAEMCGNGIRCLTKYVIDRELIPRNARGEASLDIETRAGIKRATFRRGPDGRVATVEIDMGLPEFDVARIPMSGTFDGVALPTRLDISALGGSTEVHAVSMGNPHAVLIVDDPASSPVASAGSEIEHHHAFPEGVNVEFIAIRSLDEIGMRVWERGVGETLSCGTGAAAAFAVANKLGLIRGSAKVVLPGGVLELRQDGAIMMAGPAVEVFETDVDLESLSLDDPP